MNLVFGVVCSIFEDYGFAKVLGGDRVEDVSALLEGFVVVVLISDDDTKAKLDEGVYLLMLLSRAH